MFNKESIREADRTAIRAFVSENADLLTGSVLDFGCGRKPYRDLVTGEYNAYDPAYQPSLAAVKYDTLLVTQVLEEVKNPLETMRQIRGLLKPDGHVILTFCTLWEEYDDSTLWRFTAAGMKELAFQAGLTVLKVTPKFSIPFEDFSLTEGYGFILQNKRGITQLS